MWTLDLWCRHYMVSRRGLLEDCGLSLLLQTRRGRNQLLDRDQETLMPSVFGQKSGDVSAISVAKPRSPIYYQTVGYTSGVYYPSSS